MDTDNTDGKSTEAYLYEDVTRTIIGAVFNVYNKLGYGYREKEYQKALVEEFKKLGLNFARELYCNLIYEGKAIARFYIDFLVEDKVVVELKVANDFYRKHFDQVMTYLKTNNLRVGILAVFTNQKVLIKRIIN
jgi:GxxExxY protein